MTKVLVTGATGTLGRALTRQLRDNGTDVRVMSRRERPDDAGQDDWVQADLEKGDGMDAAVDGVDAIVHCATRSTGKADVVGTRNLIAAAQRAGSPHIVYISIVGIDEIPMFYYRAKHEVEDLVATADLPWTTLRATQFHDLVLTMFTAQRFSPALIAPKMSFQPVDVRDVARRLGELATEPAAGRVPDMGGPEIHTAADLARSYLRAFDRHRRIVPVSFPGKTFAACREGHNLTPSNAVGTITFDEFLAERVGAN